MTQLIEPKSLQARGLAGGNVYVPKVEDNSSPRRRLFTGARGAMMTSGVALVALAQFGLMLTISPFSGFIVPTISDELIEEALKSNPMSFEFEMPKLALGFTLLFGSVILSAAFFGVVKLLNDYDTKSSAIAWFVSLVSLFVNGFLLFFTLIQLVVAGASFSAPQERAEMIAAMDVMNSVQTETPSGTWTTHTGRGKEEGEVFEYSGELDVLADGRYRYTFRVPQEIYEARKSAWWISSGQGEQKIHRLEKEVVGNE